MPKLTVQKLAKELGLDPLKLTDVQWKTLREECVKQAWLAKLHEQGFVRARWRGELIKPNDVIGEVKEDELPS